MIAPVMKPTGSWGWPWAMVGSPANAAALTASNPAAHITCLYRVFINSSWIPPKRSGDRRLMGTITSLL